VYKEELIMIGTFSASRPPQSAAAVPPPARHRLIAALLVAGAVVVNVAFVGLGSVFDYPDVLNQPAAEVLATFHEKQGAVSALFLLLALGAGLLAPIALSVGRLGASRLLRASVVVGVAAAVVQVAGLLRWPLLVPRLAATPDDPAAISTFHTLNVVLGTVIGETFGYALTAAWTVLVALALRDVVLGRLLSWVGLVAAALIAVGTVESLGIPMAGLLNFVGYIVWSVWLVAFAVRVLLVGRHPRT
jgi:Domain of unknown function (DUF4386)